MSMPAGDNPPQVFSVAFVVPAGLRRSVPFVAFALASFAFCLAAQRAAAQIATLDKGHQLLIDRGIPIGGLVALTSDPFHLSTLQADGFTMPMWAWNSDVST